jgi:hypothetical protein
MFFEDGVNVSIIFVSSYYSNDLFFNLENLVTFLLVLQLTIKGQ